MADDGSKQSGAAWPMPKFHFEVKWDDKVMSFQEVSGLDVEAQPIEYRHGDSKEFSVIKMPGIKKFSNITMKKGVFANDNKFWDWFNQIKMNTIKRVPMTISLLDEEGKPTMVWTLANAWPTKITGTDLKATGNEVAIETIEIAHEGLKLSSTQQEIL
jgi:phage tail-like protein